MRQIGKVFIFLNYLSLAYVFLITLGQVGEAITACQDDSQYPWSFGAKLGWNYESQAIYVTSCIIGSVLFSCITFMFLIAIRRKTARYVLAAWMALTATVVSAQTSVIQKLTYELAPYVHLICDDQHE